MRAMNRTRAGKLSAMPVGRDCAGSFLVAILLGVLHMVLEFRSLGLECFMVAVALYLYRLPRLWLDCEADTPLSPTDTVIRIIDAEGYIRDRRGDLRLGIYTGGWWWKPNTNDANTFTTLPLWTADYREPVGTPTMYGGWTEAAIWQYAGSQTVCDLNVDLNVVLEEIPMTAEERAEMDALKATVKSLQVIAWDQGVRLNAADVHKHTVDGGQQTTSDPVAP